MGQILLARSDDPHTERNDLEGMFRLRHLVFREKLGWQVQSRNGMEIDRFDEQNPVYVLSRSSRRIVDGCWRLLPTTEPYMLKDVFPQLLRGEPAPTDPHVWELSRFAVHSTGRGDLVQGSVNAVTFAMMQRAVDFALENQIRSYVTVTSVAIERLFRQAGIRLRRFGDGRAQRVGHVLSVAGWIDIDEQTRRAVHRLPLDGREAA